MENTTLFDDHNDVLLLAYKICTPVGFALNTLAIYLIVFKSTIEMKTYRWHLLNYQIWTASIDICIAFLFQPITFLPLMAIAGNGILTDKFGISTFTCLCISTNLMCGLTVSIMELFFYRHQCIVERKLSQMQFYSCILLYFLLLISPINWCLQLSYIDASQWGEFIEKKYPRAIELLKIQNIYYIPIFHLSKMIVASLFSVITLSFLLLLGLVGHTYRLLQKKYKHISVVTRKLHRRFLTTLILQVSAPLVFIFIPVVYSFIRVMDSRLGLQILNNISVLMIACYGMFATLFLIYFNVPYRKFVFGRFT